MERFAWQVAAALTAGVLTAFLVDYLRKQRLQEIFLQEKEQQTESTSSRLLGMIRQGG